MKTMTATREFVKCVADIARDVVFVTGFLNFLWVGV